MNTAGNLKKAYKNPTTYRNTNKIMFTFKYFLVVHPFYVDMILGMQNPRPKPVPSAHWSSLKNVHTEVVTFQYLAHSQSVTKAKACLLCGVSKSIRKELGVAGLMPLLCAGFAAGYGAFLGRRGFTLTPGLEHLCPQVHPDWAVPSHLGHRLHPGEGHSLRDEHHPAEPGGLPPAQCAL